MPSMAQAGQRAKLTIKDIASEAGCSIRTVSRVLNGASNVNEDTRAKVLAITRSRNYSPDPLAQSLKTKRKHTIGLIVNSVTSDANRQRIETIARLFNTAGYAILISYADDILMEEEILRRFAARTDALVIFTNLQAPGSAALDGLSETGFPFILVDPPLRGSYPAVEIDRSSGYLEVSAAPRPRGDVGRSPSSPRISAAPKGSRATAEAWRRSPSPTTRLSSSAPRRASAAGARPLSSLLALRETRDLDAALCHNDKIATGILSYVKDRGLRVPEDIALVGFDDDVIAPYLSPPLTTISQGGSEVGVHIFEQLFNALELGCPVASRVFHSSLVVRQSG